MHIPLKTLKQVAASTDYKLLVIEGTIYQLLLQVAVYIFSGNTSTRKDIPIRPLRFQAIEGTTIRVSHFSRFEFIELNELDNTVELVYLGNGRFTCSTILQMSSSVTMCVKFVSCHR